MGSSGIIWDYDTQRRKKVFRERNRNGNSPKNCGTHGGNQTGKPSKKHFYNFVVKILTYVVKRMLSIPHM